MYIGTEKILVSFTYPIKYIDKPSNKPSNYHMKVY